MIGILLFIVVCSSIILAFEYRLVRFENELLNTPKLLLIILLVRLHGLVLLNTNGLNLVKIWMVMYFQRLSLVENIAVSGSWG